MRFAKNHSFKAALLGILILLTACGGPGDNGLTSATPTLEQPIILTASPTSEPDLVYLINGGKAAEGMASRVEDLITTLSAAAGNDFIVLTEISDSDLEQNVKVVFSLPPDPGLNDLAARHPTVQFVAIGIHGLSDADNSIDESASNLAFQNGVKFYCGLCRQAYPPFHSYPLGIEASSSEIAPVQEAINTLSDLDVDTIYLSPELSAAASEEMLEGPGLGFVGGESPENDLGEKWIATVRAAPELAIAEIWDRVWMGEGGGTVSMPIIIEDINPERLTLGRESWMQEILQDLIDGYIDTGVDPITGIVR